MQVIKYVFQPHGDDRGQLVALEEFKDIPFRIKRVYYMYDTAPGVTRGKHAHKSLQQILICIAGEGWYVEEGKPTVELKEGVTVVIPANVKHWHGARKDSWFSHISIAAPGVHTDTVWCEHVTDEEYDKLD